MKRDEIVQILREFKQLTDRAINAGLADAHIFLGRVLDYIDKCPIIKEYINRCKLEIPEEQVGLKLKEFIDNSGREPLFLGNSGEGEVAFLYRAFGLLRNNIAAIQMIGYCLSPINNGTAMIATFGQKLIAPFYTDIENYFNRHMDEIDSSDRVESEVNYGILDSLLKEIDGLYVCVRFGAPLLVKWRFKAAQKLLAVFGSDSEEVRWFAESAFPTTSAGFKDERNALAETLGMLQREFTKMRNRFLPKEENRLSSTNHIQPAPSYAYDVFVSHANADKESFVNSLEAGLRESLKINVWYDTNEIDWGDSLKSQIENGLKQCRFGIVVISPEFLGREWTEKELNELLQRQNERGQKTVLPLLYHLTVDDMKKRYPALKDFKARIIKPEDEAKDIVIDFARILIHALKSETAQ